jgi:iron-sulfur cluster assembly protein
MQQLKPLLIITKTAKSKLDEIIKMENITNPYLKIEVFQGGCACSGGYRYSLSLLDEPGKEDVFEEIEGIKVVVRKQDVDIIRGSKLDFYESLQRTGFRIENPNVQTNTCGCGSH